MKALQATQWQSICQKEDLVAYSGICALINNEQVAIFYVPDREPALYAIGNWDPIGEANVLSRGIISDIDDQLTVASPLYKQHFSLTTGACLEDENQSVPVYEIHFDGDEVVVQSDSGN